MTREEAKSCIGTIEMLQRLAYSIHGVMDVIDADNCKKIIKALEQEPVLDKVRAEIKALSPKPTAYDVVDGNPVKDAVWETLIEVDKIIDKYKAESEDT